MAKHLPLLVALALLAAAQGCSNDNGSGLGGPPSGTCTPTAQTAPDPAGAAAYCEAFFGAICDRAFADCDAQLDMTGYFSSVAQCRSTYASLCESGFSGQWYDAPCGEACVAFVYGAPCSAFEGPEPQACAAATGSFSSAPPACTAAISPGTLSDTITSGDPVYDGGHARTYCITLGAGQSVVIQTSAPLSGTALGDTVLHLIDPAGAEIAYDDDGGDGLFSRIATTLTTSGEYRIVVRGYSPSYVGSYQLAVTAY